MTRARDLADRVNESAGGANKNLIINGHMVYSKEQLQHQLQLLVTIPPTDLHGHEMEAVYTQSRSTDVPSAQGFRYSLKLDNTTATGTLSGTNYHLIEQKQIEGQNLQHLLKGTSSAKKLTLSFWVKSPRLELILFVSKM